MTRLLATPPIAHKNPTASSRDELGLQRGFLGGAAGGVVGVAGGAALGFHFTAIANRIASSDARLAAAAGTFGAVVGLGLTLACVGAYLGSASVR